MRTFFTTLIVLLISLPLFSKTQENLHGAYRVKAGDTTHLALFINGYSSFISFDDKAYYNTYGGHIQLKGADIHLTLTYDQQDPERIGTTVVLPAAVLKDALHIGNLHYAKLPAQEQALDGLWQISAREDGGQMVQIPKRSRHTLKLLVSGYFQWIAIDPEAKGFYGTGGGTYTFDGHEYQEKILFFSRDNSRIGNLLKFQGTREGNQWKHRGLSSKGDPIYEIWGLE